MVSGPMRPAQNALVTVAAFLVAGSLLPWSPRVRLACAAGAIAIVLFLLLTRLRGHAGGGQSDADRAARARIDRIRSERAARMRRKR